VFLTGNFPASGQDGLSNPASMEQIIPGNTTQLVVVVSDGWEDSTATLYAFGRAGSSNAWQAAMQDIPVRVGRSGMAPGPGWPLEPVPVDAKREGDGKSPAGIYPFGFAFGYADPMKVLFTRLPYLMSNQFIECVDDPGSRYYNRLVSTDIIPDPDWKSAEHMLLGDVRYKWGIVVEYNRDPVVPGAGSCIFFHIQSPEGKSTAGCTAMAESDLVRLMEWMQPDPACYLVQMPRSAYLTLQEQHPELPGLP